MKVRRRYIAFKTVSEEEIDGAKLASSISRAVLNLWGVHGLSTIQPKLIQYKPEDGCGIVRCTHIGVQMLRLSMASISEVDGKTVSLCTLRVSGTLKALRRKLGWRKPKP